jgi:hypothetical protein
MHPKTAPARYVQQLTTHALLPAIVTRMRIRRSCTRTAPKHTSKMIAINGWHFTANSAQVNSNQGKNTVLHKIHAIDQEQGWLESLVSQIETLPAHCKQQFARMLLGLQYASAHFPTSLRITSCSSLDEIVGASSVPFIVSVPMMSADWVVSNPSTSDNAASVSFTVSNEALRMVQGPQEQRYFNVQLYDKRIAGRPFGPLCL